MPPQITLTLFTLMPLMLNGSPRKVFQYKCVFLPISPHASTSYTLFSISCVYESHLGSQWPNPPFSSFISYAWCMPPFIGPMFSQTLLVLAGSPSHNFLSSLHCPRKTMFWVHFWVMDMKKYLSHTFKMNITCPKSIWFLQLNFIHRFAGRLVVLAANIHSLYHSKFFLSNF